jgi:serine/threonine-protein kinase HipA
MLAMEDFYQLDGRLTQDKYRGSYECCAKLISKYPIQPGLDRSELFLRIVFSFVSGNSDMHLKNISLVETSGSRRRYVLSDAYDMLPVNLVLPENIDQLALTINGRKNRIQRKDFFVFAEVTGIPEKSAEKMIPKIVSGEKKYCRVLDTR